MPAQTPSKLPVRTWNI